MFSRGSQPKPSFATGILGGETTQCILYWKMCFSPAETSLIRLAKILLEPLLLNKQMRAKTRYAVILI